MITLGKNVTNKPEDLNGDWIDLDIRQDARIFMAIGTFGGTELAPVSVELQLAQTKQANKFSIYKDTLSGDSRLTESRPTVVVQGLDNIAVRYRIYNADENTNLDILLSP